MKNKSIIGVVLGLVLVLSAGLLFTLQGQKTDLPEVADAPAAESRPDLDRSTQTAGVQETHAEPTAETITETEVLVPTPRVGLAASDPASVKLASGGLQLIEAFAFW